MSVPTNSEQHRCAGPRTGDSAEVSGPPGAVLAPRRGDRDERAGGRKNRHHCLIYSDRKPLPSLLVTARSTLTNRDLTLVPEQLYLAVRTILVAVIRRRAIGYNGRMGSFDAPAPPPSRPPLQPPRPEWMAAPEGWLGGFVPLRPVLARTEEVVVTLEQFEAFPTGVQFELTVVTRRPRGGISAALRDRSGGGIRLSVAFPDGSKWQGVAGLVPPWPSPFENPPPPVLWMPGGGGSDTEYTRQAWLWPLPPAGPVTFALAWPEQKIDEATVQIDGALFRAGAAEAQQLWPPLTPEERAAAMERGLGGGRDHVFLFAHGSGEGAKK